MPKISASIWERSWLWLEKKTNKMILIYISRHTSIEASWLPLKIDTMCAEERVRVVEKTLEDDNDKIHKRRRAVCTWDVCAFDAYQTYVYANETTTTRSQQQSFIFWDDDNNDAAAVILISRKRTGNMKNSKKINFNWTMNVLYFLFYTFSFTRWYLFLHFSLPRRDAHSLVSSSPKKNIRNFCQFSRNPSAGFSPCADDEFMKLCSPFFVSSFLLLLLCQSFKDIQ